MNNIQRYQKIIKQFCVTYAFRTSSIFMRDYGTEKVADASLTNEKKQIGDDTNANLNTFNHDQRSSNINEMQNNLKTPEHYTFTSLLRYSKFIDLGDPKGKVVIGQIFHIVGDDLFIDFGWKFHCVCPKPKIDSFKYVRGAEVKLKIKNLELSTRFLGASSDLTLLEADCVLLSLVKSPMKIT